MYTSFIQSPARNFLFIKDSYTVRKVVIADILYIEAMGDYVKIVTACKSFTLHSTLKYWEDRLAEFDFVKVHRSYLVQVSKIEHIQDGCIGVANTSIPLAESYKQSVFSVLNVV
ncbi:MAG: LytTR family transcriptional regulator [Chitinophagaceae bacterium]|uniref:LytR/AlgR family response regulator transcription factor n=1 Tax=unclassified Paraflavitalea TaxID=2798305 RepID=UPI003D33FA23|nr:LytTR family transcriptional regulator [Chitinophagaceae bacterium]